jgi:hypothetical protein
MAPLQLGGLRGKKSTPSVGWEVPVISQQLASKSKEERQLPKIISRSIFVINYNIFIENGNCNNIELYIYSV